MINLRFVFCFVSLLGLPVVSIVFVADGCIDVVGVNGVNVDGLDVK